MGHLMTKPTKWLCAQRRLRSAWSVFAVCLMGSYRPKVSSCGQLRLWSDWADAQADLSLRWTHNHFVGFVRLWLKLTWLMLDRITFYHTFGKTAAIKCLISFSAWFTVKNPENWDTPKTTLQLDSTQWFYIQVTVMCLKDADSHWFCFTHLIYCKFPKYSDTQKICCNHTKIWTMWLYNRVMSPNDADGMANSVDPDQTAPAVWSGSALFAQAYLSKNLGSLWYIANLMPRFALPENLFFEKCQSCNFPWTHYPLSPHCFHSTCLRVALILESYNNFNHEEDMVAFIAHACRSLFWIIQRF